MRAIKLAVACVMVLVATAGQVQAGIITFESFANAGADYVLYQSPFDVDGYRFTGNLFGNDYLIFKTGSPHFAGSTALAPYIGETHTFQRIDGLPFNLLSFDYSEHDTFSAAGTVTFTGNFVGGGSISKDVTTDGVFGFESATFAGFNNLSSVVFSYPGTNGVYFQLDNISVTAVPEPSSAALLGLGLISMGAVGVPELRRRKREAAA
jgi:hypothetical protein